MPGKGRLSRAGGEGDRQLSTWVGHTEEELRGGGATLLARVPHLHDGLYVGQPRHQDGITGVEDNNGVRIDRGHSLDELVLILAE